jgi:chromate transporter
MSLLEEEKVDLNTNKSSIDINTNDFNNDDNLKTIDIENSNPNNSNSNSNSNPNNSPIEDTAWSTRMWEVFTTYLPLGFVAFGGPQAHVAILRDHLVVQRDWMDETQFTELFAIGQGLPGPTSTQLVISTALARAGPLGGLLAFFLWNIPGLVILTTCGVLVKNFIDPNDPPFYLVGVAPAAISLVFKAFYGFTAKLDNLGIVLSLISASVTILISGDVNIPITSSQYVFPSMLVMGSLISLLDSKRSNPYGTSYNTPNKGWDVQDDLLMKRIGIPLWVGTLIFLSWGGILLLVILLKDTNVGLGIDNKYLDIFETMYRIGSLIFGGGQVVLPMLQSEVDPKWMSTDHFFQGLGLAQSLPGPLFNFSAYLGAVYAGTCVASGGEYENDDINGGDGGDDGIVQLNFSSFFSFLLQPFSYIHTHIYNIQIDIPGALVAYVGLFGPGVILIFAMVPFWARLRHITWFKVILHGLNATAIGLVGAACVILWEAAIGDAADAIVFIVAGTLAAYFNVQAPIVVLVGCVLGAILCDDAANLGQKPY